MCSGTIHSTFVATRHIYLPCNRTPCDDHFGVKTIFRYRALPALYAHSPTSLLPFSSASFSSAEYAQKSGGTLYPRARVALVETRGRVRLPTIATHEVIYIIRCRVGLT